MLYYLNELKTKCVGNKLPLAQNMDYVVPELRHVRDGSSVFERGWVSDGRNLFVPM